MPFRDILPCHVLVRLLRVNSGNESPDTELTRELEELRKVSLNLACTLRRSFVLSTTYLIMQLMAFLTVHAISPSSAFGTITLALLVYTINLHITINAGFLRHTPTLSRFLHAIPLLGILSMTIFQLVIVVQSPPVAVAVLFACALPPLMIWVHLARRYIEMIFPSSRGQMRKVVSGLPVSTSNPIDQ